LDIAVEALALLKDRIPTAELHLYGDGPMRDALMEQAGRLGLQNRVRYLGGTTLERVADVIANADIGVVPKRADSFGDEAFSTKIFEFMSQGVPVVVSRTKVDSFYFDDRVVQFFPSGDAPGMARAILNLFEDRRRREELVQHGLECVQRCSWESRKEDYFELVDSLSRGPLPRRIAAGANEIFIENRV
jgi:glycosyltransferase involved in cell wall biosynthesis